MLLRTDCVVEAKRGRELIGIYEEKEAEQCKVFAGSTSMKMEN